MIRLVLRTPGEMPASSPRRRRFGLDTPLPANPNIIERAVLRHLAEQCPAILVLALVRPSPSGSASVTADLASGVPDLLLLLPGGRLACLTIKTQAQRLSRHQKAFADLCRERRIPSHVVRSLSEARAVLDRLNVLPGEDRTHA